MNKRAISPLVATILLLAFALVIGVLTMTWGRSYVDTGAEASPEDEGLKTGAIVISIEDILDSELKLLQVQFLSGKMTQEEYLQKEKEIVG